MKLNEVWKPIPNYEELYWVSNLGNIKSKNKILKPTKNRDGYLYIHLYKNKKQTIKGIHIIVAKTFIPNPLNKTQVNHIDGDKWNNKIDNLEWVTPKENINHAYKIGLRNNDYIKRKIAQYDLNDNFIKVWDSLKEINETLNYSINMISYCCNGKFKTAYGYKWKHIN